MEQTKQWPPQLSLQPEAAHCWCECHSVLLRWTKSPIADLTQAANNQLTARAEKHQTKPSHQRHKTRLWAKHIIRVAPPIWLTSCLLPPDSQMKRANEWLAFLRRPDRRALAAEAGRTRPTFRWLCALGQIQRVVAFVIVTIFSPWAEERGGRAMSVSNQNRIQKAPGLDRCVC